MGLNERVAAVIGKRFVAGSNRPFASISSTAPRRYAVVCASGSYHWMSIVMMSQPCGFSFSAM